MQIHPPYYKMQCLLRSYNAPSLITVMDPLIPITKGQSHFPCWPSTMFVFLPLVLSWMESNLDTTTQNLIAYAFLVYSFLTASTVTPVILLVRSSNNFPDSSTALNKASTVNMSILADFRNVWIGYDTGSIHAFMGPWCLLWARNMLMRHS